MHPDLIEIVIHDTAGFLLQLGRELAGLCGRDNLDDDDCRTLAREWLEAFAPAREE